MKNYTAQSTDLRTFQLLDNETVLGSVYYEKWYSFNATIDTEGQTYTTLFSNFWGTELEIVQAEDVLATLKTNWMGKIVVRYRQQNFLLTTKGFLQYHYILLDENEQEVAAFRPNFSMKKFRFDYAIKTSVVLEPLLLLALVHCINYQMSSVYMGAVSVPV